MCRRLGGEIKTTERNSKHFQIWGRVGEGGDGRGKKRAANGPQLCPPTRPAPVFHRMKCCGQGGGPRPPQSGERNMLALAHAYSACRHTQAPRASATQMHRDPHGNTQRSGYTHVRTALPHVCPKAAERRTWREGGNEVAWSFASQRPSSVPGTPTPDSSTTQATGPNTVWV